MQVEEVRTVLDLPDTRVAVSGDWHGNVTWIRLVARATRALAPDVRTILQLGDWWADDPRVDEVLAECGIDRVLVTLGNHEDYGALRAPLADHPGSAIRVTERQWVLSRPFNFTIGGRRFLSLGGASSIDKLYRVEGYSWWPDELITDEQVEAAVAGGGVDVMLTHESPGSTPVKAVQEVLRANPLGIDEEARMISAASRVRVRQVWNSVNPKLLAHGHMHIPAGGTTPDGRRVSSLGADGQQGNLAFLDLRTLELDTPSLREIRAAGGDAG